MSCWEVSDQTNEKGENEHIGGRLLRKQDLQGGRKRRSKQHNGKEEFEFLNYTMIQISYVSHRSVGGRSALLLSDD